MKSILSKLAVGVAAAFTYMAEPSEAQAETFSCKNFEGDKGAYVNTNRPLRKELKLFEKDENYNNSTRNLLAVSALSMNFQDARKAAQAFCDSGVVPPLSNIAQPDPDDGRRWEIYSCDLGNGKAVGEYAKREADDFFGVASALLGEENTIKSWVLTGTRHEDTGAVLTDYTVNSPGLDREDSLRKLGKACGFNPN